MKLIKVVFSTDIEIDRLVCELYGLTEEEIEIIEQGKKIMSLSEIYNRVRSSIVAFVPKYFKIDPQEPKTPALPSIFGTGFIFREDGLIATNNHVLTVFDQVLRDPNNPKEWPVLVMLFTPSEKGMLQIPLEVLNRGGISKIEHKKEIENHYKISTPDLGYVQVKAKGLPVLELENSECLVEGMEIATAGFPMGENLLVEGERLKQVTPIVQKGIVSSVLPFPSKNNTGFMINVMSQGGASGSPVFLPESGKVIGILFARVYDSEKTAKGDWVRVPTNFSYCVPSNYLKHMMENHLPKLQLELPADTISLGEIFKKSKQIDILDWENRNQL